MSGFSVNDAMAKLGIYKSEAEALDAMDGKKDGKISKDIFTQAQEALTNAEAMYSEDNADETLDMSKWSDVAKNMARTITQRMGIGAFIYSSNKSEDFQTKVDEDTLESAHEDMNELAGEAADYIAEHKTLEGFKFKGVPNGVTNIKINVDDYYGNGENDVVSFDSDGKAVVEKVIDGIAFEIHYSYKGNDYAMGTVIETEEEDSGSTDGGTADAAQTVNPNNTAEAGAAGNNSSKTKDGTYQQADAQANTPLKTKDGTYQ